MTLYWRVQSKRHRMQTADTLAHIADEGRVRRAKRFGEKSNFFDPEVSEWENPVSFIADNS